jgi:hypothetical protein
MKYAIPFMLMCIVASTSHAQTQIVNINGVTDQIGNNGYNVTAWNPQAVSLAAGTYNITPITPTTTGAFYTAYNYYPGGPWSSGYVIGLQSPQQVSGYEDNGEMDYDGFNVYFFYTGVYPDASTAFANALSGSFTITNAETVYFGVGDTYYGDNSGGVSLQLTFTPIQNYALPSSPNITVTATNAVLAWCAPTNDVFQVVWTTNLAPPVVWTPFPDTITSAGSRFSYTDTNAPVPMKFYQLILLP